MFGLLNLHKPVGPTSHDIVAQVRRLTRIRKIGHAGTLDPLASGVLVLCLGPATRLSEYAMRSPKHYRATVRLGAVTNTYDAEGEIIARQPVGALTAPQIEAALVPFTGEIEQVPPMYSAIKQGGRRLYDLAREGQDVSREARRVTIDRIEIAALELPDVVLDVTCSPGTYIRSLAHDLGAALGTGAYLAGLVRTASGHFRLEDALPLAEFEAAAQAGDWQQHLLPPERALAGAAQLRLDDAQTQRVLHGNAIEDPEDAAGLACGFDPAGTLLAVLEAREGYWQPVKVFPPEAT
ncbi:MAG: tRNA pseudouridine(55) synthase TruB [Anaerolineae bacterium]|nr:tRNA pseudouridine(55) synthase TruB [Anaerolineae bacterium]